MSDANRTSIRVAKELSFATALSNPRFDVLRVTSAQLQASPQTKTTSELRSDRQIPDLVRTGFQTGGSLGMEWSYGAPDPLLEGSCYNTWTRFFVRDNDGTAASNITSVAISGVYNFVASAGTDQNDKSGASMVGAYIRASGFSVAGNNGIGRVTAGTATQITVNGITTAAEASPPGTARLKMVGIQAPAAAGISTTATGLAAGSSGAIVGVGVDFQALGVVAGMWLKISGLTIDTDCNGWYRVLSVPTTTRIECDIVPTGFGADAGTGVQAVIWLGDYIRNGTTPISYFCEATYEDLAPVEYDGYKGMGVTSAEFSLGQQDIPTIAFNFIGASATNSTARTTNFSGAATDRTQPSNDVYNTSSSVARIGEAGAVISGNYVTSLSCTIDNQLRGRGQVGSAAFWSLGSGRAQIGGRISTYYTSNAILTKLRNGTASSLDFRIDGGSNTNAVVVDMPRVKYKSGDVQVSGVDTDRTLDLEYQALRHSTLGYTIHIQRMSEYA